MTEADKVKFAAIVRESIVQAQGREGGIGTLGEKRMHAMLKDYLSERESQEIPVGVIEDGAAGTAGTAKTAKAEASQKGQVSSTGENRTARKRAGFVADVFDGTRIYEVQTGSFYPLRTKLAYYLSHTEYPVTVVHPVAAVKYLSWIDPATGEVSPSRRSPKKGRVQDVAGQLYWLIPFAASGRLSLRILLCEVREYRWRNGWGRDGKRGSERYERIPTALVDDVTLSTPSDFAAYFLPDSLPDPFTAAEFSRASGIRGKAAYGVLGLLTALGVLCEGGKRGRSKVWERKKVP